MVLVALAAPALAAESATLWQIGKADKTNTEFALAPAGYRQFKDDAFFVVGKSDPKLDWPYAQPGPADSWAGGRQHTFVIAFGLKAAPADGSCKLIVDLIDTQRGAPPQLRIDINGRAFMHNTPNGGGDESINGQPARGRPHHFEVAFPANLLRAGANDVSITTAGGSWILYDAVALEAPTGLQLAPVTGTIIYSVKSAPMLIQKDGKLYQTVEVALRHFSEPAEATLTATGAVPMKLALKPGAQSVEIVVPAVQRETNVSIALAAEGKTIASQEQAVKPVRKWVVYLLPHSHNDIGYTHVQTEVEHNQWKFLDIALDTCTKTANYPAGSQFRWNVEVMWAVDSYLKQATPERRKQFIDAVKAGRIELDALYGNELTGLCRPEELVHLIDCALRVSKEAGVPLQSAMISDVPGYTWGLMSVFADAGVKYFSVGPNGGDRVGRTNVDKGDKPFYWIPPSGKGKVLCWVAGQGYHYFHAGPLPKRIDGVLQYLQRLESNQYPYDIVQMRYNIGGDNGPPDPALPDYVREWNNTHAYPKFIIATTREMCQAFEAKYADVIPKESGDFTPYWEDGAASTARETALNRDAAERLVQAEALFAMLKPTAYPADAFYTAWRNVVLYDEHTWGAHNSISQPDLPFVKQQWAIKQAFALDGEKQSRKLIADAIGQRAVSGQIDVFNTNSWPRTDLVIVSKEMSSQGDLVRDREGQKVPSQRLSTGELAFVAKDVPPFAGRRYSIARGAANTETEGKALAEGNTLISPDLGLTVDEKSGGISNLQSCLPAIKGQTFTWEKAARGLNEYLYLPGSDPKAAQRNGAVKISVKEKGGPVVASLLIESDAPGCNKLTREIRVYAGVDRVDIIDNVDKKAIRTKEGVHFAFNFNVDNATIRMDTPWAIVRPEQDQIPGACKNWFTIQRFIDISNDNSGITWAIVDAPLVEMGGLTANLLGSQTNPNAWIEHIKPSTTFYSWVMNNHWHTNYKADQDGPTIFRYALRPHGKFDPAEAQRFGIERSQGLIVAPAEGGEMGEPRLRIDAPGVIVTALKPSEDGKALIVRLYAASGKDEKATLTWSDPKPAAMYLSNVAEIQGQKVDGPIAVPANGFVTIRAERQ